MTNLSFEERYKNASKALRKAGIKTYRNVQGCCRSCIGSDKFDEPTEPILWHYGGQGNRIEFSGNYVTWAKEGGFVNTFYLNHSNITPDLADKIVEIFAENGIVIEWDKSDSSCVGVKPMLSVAHRTEHEQAILIDCYLRDYNLAYEEMFKWTYNVRLLETMWDLAVTDEDIRKAFERKRNELDERERELAEREARNNYYKAQQDLAEKVYGLISEERLERFKAWFEMASPELSESDVADNGARLLATELEAYVGEFGDREDFAKKHYGDDVERLPKWVLDNISWNNIAHDLGRNRFFISQRGWSAPAIVWKR